MTDSRLESLEKRLADLPCLENSQRLATVEAKVDGIRNDIEKIRTNDLQHVEAHRSFTQWAVDITITTAISVASLVVALIAAGIIRL